MSIIFSASMMCANFSNLQQEVESLENAGIDMFHLDIMDGIFVPNFGMGLQDLEYIISKSTKPCDVHLMIANPSQYINLFSNLGSDVIYVHPETDPHITRTLQMIKDHNVSPGIALNPGTSIETVKHILSLADYILVMSVNPGFSGQSYLDFVDKKIEQLCKEREQYNYKIIVDGACSPERIKKLKSIGVDGFILGTSALFNKEKGYSQILKELRDN